MDGRGGFAKKRKMREVRGKLVNIVTLFVMFYRKC
jgi:hypothetical protein